MSINVFIQRLLSGWRVLLFSISIWIGVAIGFLIIYPKQWEATAYIRLASFDGNNIENEATTMALLRSNGVIAAVLDYLKMPVSDKTINKIHRWTRIRALEKNHLQISIRSDDRQLAINLVNGMFMWLKKEQDPEIDEKIESIRTMIQYNNDIIKENIIEENETENPKMDFLTLFYSYDMKFQGANNLIALYQGLDPYKAKRTKLVIPVYSAADPVFPKAIRILIIAAMMGVLTCIIWIFGCKDPNSKQ